MSILSSSNGVAFCTGLSVSHSCFAEINNPSHCHYLCLVSMSYPAHEMASTFSVHPSDFFLHICLCKIDSEWNYFYKINFDSNLFYI